MVTVNIIRKVDTNADEIQRELITYLIHAELGDAGEITSQSDLLAVLRRSALGSNAEGLELAGSLEERYGLDRKTVVDAFYDATSEAEVQGRKVTVGEVAKLIYDRLK